MEELDDNPVMPVELRHCRLEAWDCAKLVTYEALRVHQ